MVDIQALLKDANPPYLANKDWEPGRPVYYSGPYWDNRELEVIFNSFLNGKWLFLVKRLISLSVSFPNSLESSTLLW